MKLEQGVEEKEVLVVGEDNSINSTVDTEDMAFVLHILSSNLYANPVESLIREYTTNAWDAQKEVGNDEPIIVTIDTDNQGSYWSVKDNGTGLSPDMIRKVYSKFGKSTKRGTNEQHGMWGLGKYSGLSYTDNIHIETIVDGIKYLYLMYKAQVGIKIDLLYDEPTDQKNGTEIKIYLKNYSDRAKFVEGCKSQLAYFENVYFNIKEINNNYKIHTGTSFKCCELYPRDEMHVILGAVVYPIPWGQLGITMLKSPMGLTFNIGELGVTPNRESILIKENTKELILSKIRILATEVITKFNFSAGNCTNIEKYFSEVGKPKKLSLNNKVIVLNELDNYSDIKSNPLMFAPYPNIGATKVSIHSVTFNYPVTYGISRFLRNPGKPWMASGFNATHIKSVREYHSVYKSNTQTILNPDYTNTLYVKGSIQGTSPVTLRYIFDKHPHIESIVAVGKRTLWDYVWYLNLPLRNKSKWRADITEYNKFVEEHLKSKGIIVKDLSSYVPDAEWIAEDKLKRKRNFDYHALRKADNKILIHNVRRSSRWNGDNLGVLEKQEIKVKELMDIRKTVVYDILDNREKELEMLYFTNYKNLTPICVSKYNAKYFELMPNFISREKFMECKNKITAKVVTAHIILEFLKENSYLLSAKEFIKNLNVEYYNKIIKLESFVKQSTLLIPYNCNGNWDKLLKELIEISKITKYYDYEMLAILKDVRNKSKSLEFVKHLKGYSQVNITHNTDFYINDLSKILPQEIDFAVEYIKFKKEFRLDLKYYQNEYLSSITPVVKVETEPEVEILEEAKPEVDIPEETDDSVWLIDKAIDNLSEVNDKSVTISGVEFIDDSDEVEVII